MTEATLKGVNVDVLCERSEQGRDKSDAFGNDKAVG
jgi:hypothetical protein